MRAALNPAGGDPHTQPELVTSEVRALGISMTDSPTSAQSANGVAFSCACCGINEDLCALDVRAILIPISEFDGPYRS